MSCLTLNPQNSENNDENCELSEKAVHWEIQRYPFFKVCMCSISYEKLIPDLQPPHTQTGNWLTRGTTRRTFSCWCAELLPASPGTFTTHHISYIVATSYCNVSQFGCLSASKATPATEASLIVKQWEKPLCVQWTQCARMPDCDGKQARRSAELKCCREFGVTCGGGWNMTGMSIKRRW